MKTKNIILMALLVVVVLVGLYAGTILINDNTEATNESNLTLNDTNDTLNETVNETINKTTTNTAKSDKKTETTTKKSNSNKKSDSDIVSESIQENYQQGDGSYYRQVEYKDGNFRQYDTKTGKLIGSSYDSDQGKLREMYGDMN